MTRDVGLRGRGRRKSGSLFRGHTLARGVRGEIDSEHSTGGSLHGARQQLERRHSGRKRDYLLIYQSTDPIVVTGLTGKGRIVKAKIVLYAAQFSARDRRGGAVLLIMGEKKRRKDMLAVY